MGRVFQYHEIEAGLVPSTVNFEAAANAFSDQVSSAIEQGYVDGAFIFGSVAGLLNSSLRAVPNRRSDMDCFVVLTNYSSGSLTALKSIARSIEDASNHMVAAQPIVYQRDQLANGHIPGMHEMDPMFGTDLMGTGRFVIGQDPAEYMQFPNMSPYAVYNAFIAQKRRKLHNGLAQEPESEQGVRTVQRYLELPVSMGRKAIQALMLDGQYTDEGFWAADKQQVLAITSKELFSDEGNAVSLMEKILEHDIKYNALLSRTLLGQADESEYRTTLRELADYTSGIEWLNYIHGAISTRLGSTEAAS